jgi:hypothetical protein
MTLIACTLNRSVPILLADILISGNQQPDSFILPSRNENLLDFFKGDTGHQPVCLLRKPIYLKARFALRLQVMLSQ